MLSKEKKQIINERISQKELQLISDLKNEDSKIRSKVAKILIESRNPQIIKPLIELLKEKNLDRNIAISISNVLGKFGDIALEPLISALDDEDYNFRRRVEDALVKMGDRNLNRLLDALEKGKPIVRGSIIRILGNLRDTRALETLINSLIDVDEKVRREAANALGCLGDIRAVEPLIEALQDDDEGVRMDAAESLGNLDDKRAVEPLIELLSSEDSDVRFYSASSLCKLYDSRAIDPMIRALQLYNDPYLIMCLIRFGDPKAVKPIIRALPEIDEEFEEEKGAEAYKIGEFLGDFGDKSDVETLIKYLDDNLYGINFIAAIALGILGDSRALYPLIKFAKSFSIKEYWRQGEAIIALGKLRDKRAEKILLDIFKDERSRNNHNQIRNAAIFALVELKSPQTLKLLLEDEDKEVRNNTVYWIFEMEDESVLKLFINILRELDEKSKVMNFIEAIRKVRFLGRSSHLLKTLIEMTGPTIIDTLLKFLKDKNEHIRSSIATILGDAGSLQAVGPLISLLNDESDTVRSSAAESLGKLGNIKAVEPLIKVVKNKSKRVRHNAVQSLGNLGDKRGIEPLIGALNDEDKDVNTCSAVSLAKLGEEIGIDHLLKSLIDDDESIRKFAAKSLGQLGNKKAIKPLINMLETEKENQITIALSLCRFKINKGFEFMENYLNKIWHPFGIIKLEELPLNSDDLALFDGKKAVDYLKILLIRVNNSFNVFNEWVDEILSWITEQLIKYESREGLLMSLKSFSHRARHKAKNALYKIEPRFQGKSIREIIDTLRAEEKPEELKPEEVIPMRELRSTEKTEESDSIKILKLRLAKGELSIDEYNRLKKILEE